MSVFSHLGTDKERILVALCKQYANKTFKYRDLIDFYEKVPTGITTVSRLRELIYELEESGRLVFIEANEFPDGDTITLKPSRETFYDFNGSVRVEQGEVSVDLIERENDIIIISDENINELTNRIDDLQDKLNRSHNQISSDLKSPLIECSIKHFGEMVIKNEVFRYGVKIFQAAISALNEKLIHLHNSEADEGIKELIDGILKVSQDLLTFMMALVSHF